MALCFIKQTEGNCHRDDVGKGDDERKPGDTGEFGDLDQQPMIVLRNSQAVPAETTEQPAANPVMSYPRARAQKSAEKVAPRAHEMPWRDDSGEPAPKRPMQRQVQRQQQWQRIEEKVVEQTAQ